MFEPIIETKTSTAYFQHSILYVILKPGSVISSEEAHAQLEAWRKISNEIKGDSAYGLCIDLTGIRSITKEARMVYSNGKDLNNVGIALLITSPYDAVVANFFIRLNRPGKSIKLFFSRNKSEGWLRKKLKNWNSLVA